MIIRVIVGAVLTMSMLGCAGLTDEPPNASPEALAPTVVPDDPAAKGIAHVTVPALSESGLRRRTARFTMRVRNLSCEGVARGSGFAISSRTLITNRHVVAGAMALEVNTTDGRLLEVTAASVAVVGDVAFVEVESPLPATAKVRQVVGDGETVTAVGFPLGGPFTMAEGTVIDHVDGTEFGIPGPVLRINAKVQPGNSGGPLIDRSGQVVGIVFALERATGLGLVIPVSTYQSIVKAGGREDIPACGAS